MRDGLLVRQPSQFKNEPDYWFIPMREGMQIAGIDIEPANSLLKLLFAWKQGADSWLVHQVFSLIAGHSRDGGSNSAHKVSLPAGLDKRSEYALPSMLDCEFQLRGSVEFFEPSGVRHQLIHDGSLIQPSDPAILLSTGMQQVVGIERGGRAALEVMRRSTKDTIRRFELPFEHFPDRFHDMVWSSSTGCLAYCLKPTEWTVLGGTGAAHLQSESDFDFQTEPAERVISVNMKQDGPHALLWSDARYGGTGMIEAVRFNRGARVRTKQPIDLGEDANRIVRIEESNAKLLMISIDDDGAPAKLISLRHKKSASKQAREEVDLNAIKEACPRLEPGEIG
ncbi:MAG: hypothetical protein SXU28_02200 [Pseudomonadota bacterium]|nr:hypothetical protein [Pseudomonadota bacterium]